MGWGWGAGTWKADAFQREQHLPGPRKELGLRAKCHLPPAWVSNVLPIVGMPSAAASLLRRQPGWVAAAESTALQPTKPAVLTAWPGLAGEVGRVVLD